MMNSAVSGLTLPTYKHCCISLIICGTNSISVFIFFLIYPDPSLTVETVLRVMEKVTNSSAEEVWRGFFVSNTWNDIKSKCSTERELLHTCADIFVNCRPDSSWEDLARVLYCEEETAAVEEVRSYLNPRGWFCQCLMVRPSISAYHNMCNSLSLIYNVDVELSCMHVQAIK